MILQMRYLATVLFAILALGLPACGTMNEGNQNYAMGSAVADSDLSGFGKIAEGAPWPPPPETVPVPAPKIASVPPPLPARAPTSGDTKTRFLPEESSVPGPTVLASLTTQQRVIVRTVDMTIEVANVSTSIDVVAKIASDMGGWIVTSNRSEKHWGFVSVRIPAERLQDVVQILRDMAAEVKSERTTSQDVTEEYFDGRARLVTLEAERDAYQRLFDGAKTTEEALKVREALSRVQGELEVLQGRINRIEQTAAFSLVNVSLVLEPTHMAMDAGADQTAGEGYPVRFRAKFRPPDGIDTFTYTWEFGDGSEVVTSSSTAPTENESERVTATITHIYHDEKDSPFIAQIKLTGIGKTGVAEGEDTINVNITRVPVIEVFAGDNMTVEQGEEIQFKGSFTRSESLKNVRYRWDFDDGTADDTGEVANGITNALATHVYTDYRPFAYNPRLTITADSDAGTVEGTGRLSVQVREAKGWTIAGWSAGDQGKDAIRALSGVGAGIVTGIIWLVIFSPIWGVAGFLGYKGFRRFRPTRL